MSHVILLVTCLSVGHIQYDGVIDWIVSGICFHFCSVGNLSYTLKSFVTTKFETRYLWYFKEFFLATLLISQFFHQDFQKLKQSHTKAMNTIEDLRDCLEMIRKERQDLFEEVTSLQRREQTARVREIISSYQEKGALDEGERERQRHEQTDSDEGIFSESQASSTASFSARRSERSAKRSSNQSPHFRATSPTARKRSSSEQRYNTHDDLSPTRSREIYPHRKSYSPQNRSASPADGQRSRRPFVDEYFINKTLEEIEDDLQKEKQKLFESLAVQPKKIRFSSEHSRNGHSTADQYFRAISEHKRRQSPDRLNKQSKQTMRSDHSKVDHHRRRHQSPSPGQRSPRASILKSSDTFNQSSTVPSRSPSPSLRKNRSINTDRERSVFSDRKIKTLFYLLFYKKY